eukprot:761370-Hanusia_phi.AAC.3
MNANRTQRTLELQSYFLRRFSHEDMPWWLKLEHDAITAAGERLLSFKLRGKRQDCVRIPQIIKVQQDKHKQAQSPSGG